MNGRNRGGYWAEELGGDGWTGRDGRAGEGRGLVWREGREERALRGVQRYGESVRCGGDEWMVIAQRGGLGYNVEDELGRAAGGRSKIG